MSHSHSDFTLPGLSYRASGLSSYIVAISFAYSGQWNSRLLENHFHSFWNFVLLDLVDDLAPDVIVIPQFQLDILDDKPLADTSITTTAQTAAKELTPDFSIAVFKLVRRHVPAALPVPPLFPADFNLWRDVRVNMMKIPLIAELKRPPSRRAKSRRIFSQDLRTRMDKAEEDLVKQVEYAFLMQPSVDEIVLVACCGEWWSWMVSTRAAHVSQQVSSPQDVTRPPNRIGDTDDDPIKIEDEEKSIQFEEEVEVIPHDLPELRTREIHPRPAKMHHKGKYREVSPPPPSESDKIPYRPHSEADEEPDTKIKFIRYTELEEGAMEYVKPNAEDAIPPDDEWSLPILFGSEASAQHFFLIHRFLEGERLMPGTGNQVSLYPYSLDVNLMFNLFDFRRRVADLIQPILKIVCQTDLRRRRKWTQRKRKRRKRRRKKRETMRRGRIQTCTCESRARSCIRCLLLVISCLGLRQAYR